MHCSYLSAIQPQISIFDTQYTYEMVKGFEAHLSLKGKDKKQSADSDKEDEQEITEKYCG